MKQNKEQTLEERKRKLMKKISEEGHSFPHYWTCATCEEDFNEVYLLGRIEGVEEGKKIESDEWMTKLLPEQIKVSVKPDNKTMHETYGEPDDKAGKHLCCSKCGMCLTCGDCICNKEKEQRA